MPELRAAILLLIGLVLVGRTPVLVAQDSAAAAAATGEEPVAIDMWVDETAVAVGDELRVHVRYRWPVGWTPAEEPRPARAFDAAGAFLVDVPAPQALQDGRHEVRTWELGVLATRSGTWKLPQPGLQVQDPDGRPHTASAPVVVLEVGTESEPVEPAPASPLWYTANDPSARPAPIWPWLLGAVALAAVMLALLLRRREREPPLSPAERFSRDLHLARVSTDGKAAASALSQALRRYVGASYGFDGVGATTAELRVLLQPHLDAEARRRLLELLEALDAQRWAPEDLDNATIQPLIDRATAWVGAEEERRSAAADGDEDQPTG